MLNKGYFNRLSICVFLSTVSLEVFLCQGQGLCVCVCVCVYVCVCVHECVCDNSKMKCSFEPNIYIYIYIYVLIYCIAHNSGRGTFDEFGKTNVIYCQYLFYPAKFQILPSIYIFDV